MKMIYLAFKMIWKQKFLNLFLIITIIFSISYLSPVLNRVINYKTSIQALENLDMKNAYYLYCNPFYSRNNAKLRDAIEERIADLPYVIGRAEFFNLQDDKESYHIMIYNNLLIDKFTPQLHTGTWFNQAIESSYIPAVVTSDTHLAYGDTIPLSFSIDGKTLVLTGKVIGILEDSAKILSFSSTADEDYFTSDALISSVNNTIILPLTQDIQKLIKNQAYLLNSNGSLLYTSSEANYNSILENFGYSGIVTDLDKGNNQFYEQSKIVATAMGTYFLVYLFIAVVCLLCSSFILNISTQKMYTIYFLFGMSHSDRIIIEGIRIALMIFTCTMLSFLFIIQNGILTSFFSEFHPLIIFIGLICYISLIFIPICLGFLIKNKHVNFMESIHNLNIQTEM